MLRLAYDGTGFRGFAAQDGQPTVAGALAEALERSLRTGIALTCAGRTDAGVHALDQVVHFDLPEAVSRRCDPQALLRSCNRQLAPAIVVRVAAPVTSAFDARRSAVARRYRYLVVNGPVPDPLLAGMAWHVADPLDLRALSTASDAVLGEHDFRAFCRRVPGTETGTPILRRVMDARWTEAGGTDGAGRGRGRVPTGPVTGRGAAAILPVVGRLLAFEIEGNAFCHQMVRSLVGTLVDIGRGRKRPSDMLWILRSTERRSASSPAPPHGLTLLEVRYGDALTGML